MPDARTYPDAIVEVPVNATDLLRRFQFGEWVSGTDDWPMVVVFLKTTPDPALHGHEAEPCWQLARSFAII